MFTEDIYKYTMYYVLYIIHYKESDNDIVRLEARMRKDEEQVQTWSVRKSLTA